VKNFIEVEGTVKKVKSFSDERGTLVTGWFTQRLTDPIEMTTLNVGLVAKKDTVGAQLAQLPDGAAVTVIGRLLTRVNRKDPKNPQYIIQIEVDELI